VALPIGRYYKVRETPPSRAVSNELLETVFKRNGKILPNHDEIVVSFDLLSIISYNRLTVAGAMSSK